MPPADVSPSPLLESWQVLDFLVALVEKSLVVFDESSSGNGQGDGGRYRLLETIRQYGAERLVESGAEEVGILRGRHRAYFLQRAEEAAPHLHGPQAATYLAALAADHDNFRGALNGFADAAAHQVEGAAAVEAGGRLCVALFEFWSVRGFFKEGRDYCQAFVDLDVSGPDSTSALPAPLRADLLRSSGVFQAFLNDFDTAETLLFVALDLYRIAQNHKGTSECLVTLGIMADHRSEREKARLRFNEGLNEARLSGDGRATAVALTNVAHLSPPEEQTALHEEVLAIYRKQGDMWGVAQALGHLSWLRQREGDETAAAVLMEECRALRETLGDRHGLGWLLRGIARAAVMRGDREKALSCYREAIEIFRSISNREGMGWMQFYAAMLPVADGIWPDGDDEAARKDLRDALGNFVTIKEPGSIRYILEGLGLRLTLSDPEKAVVLWGAGRRLRNELNTSIETEEAVWEKAREDARSALGEAAWEAAFARGLILSTADAVELALVP